MNDRRDCPICSNKLRNTHYTGFLHAIGREGHFIKRLCTQGPNHRGLHFMVDLDTQRVVLIKLSLNPQYTKYVEIDFENKRCRIHCLQNAQTLNIIELEKLLHPDFPALTQLKEKIDLYLALS